MLLVAVVALLTSLLTALFLIRYIHLHKHVSCDHSPAKPQDFHLGLTPRIGGIPIIAGIGLGAAVAWYKGLLVGSSLLAWTAATAPAFLFGLAEDLTGKVAPRWRLAASFSSAVIGIYLLNALLVRLEVPGLDILMANHVWLSIIITMVAVGGICHSLNLIDGYNGLAGGVAVMVLVALGYVCLLVGDNELATICIISTATTIGFLTLNYPRGYIFAGDGGAYLLGFIIAEVSVLLVTRHPQISPWFPFTMMIYPIWETIFTIYRRKMVQGQAAGLPDALHLHQMVFNRLVRWMVGKREHESLRLRNARTTPYLWGMGLITVIPALLFRDNTLALQIICGLFVLFYGWLYRRLALFRAPKWLITR